MKGGNKKSPPRDGQPDKVKTRSAQPTKAQRNGRRSKGNVKPYPPPIRAEADNTKPFALLL